MTERLYYTDCYLRRFTAHIAAVSDDGLGVRLDRTAFYPASGGQPFDTGTLADIRVVGVAEDESGILHQLASPLGPGPAASAIEGAIDWPRRFDHMQQHTGQHLLSAVFETRFGAKTVGFHMGAESSTIDLEGHVDPSAAAEAELDANRIVCENRGVAIAFEEAAQAQGLRKAAGRQGELRIVSIRDLDRSACGGTHVRSTGEIGAVLLGKLEKVRHGVRVEFRCGERAIRRARADYETLSRTAQVFSAPSGEVPALAAAQLEAARAQDKARRKLELELAACQGRELYRSTAPDSGGCRRVTHRAGSGSVEDLRAIARSFTAQPKAVFLATLANPPSVLLAVSADAAIDAGKLVKAALAEEGGRGGGTPGMAQGSVPGAAELERVVARLTEECGGRGK
jgi:alanyl-tRNA synthetase